MLSSPTTNARQQGQHAPVPPTFVRCVMRFCITYSRAGSCSLSTPALVAGKAQGVGGVRAVPGQVLCRVHAGSRAQEAGAVLAASQPRNLAPRCLEPAHRLGIRLTVDAGHGAAVDCCLVCALVLNPARCMGEE